MYKNRTLLFNLGLNPRPFPQGAGFFLCLSNYFLYYVDYSIECTD